jgi:hypothetical protein
MVVYELATGWCLTVHLEPASAKSALAWIDLHKWAILAVDPEYQVPCSESGISKFDGKKGLVDSRGCTSTYFTRSYQYGRNRLAYLWPVCSRMVWHAQCT